MLNVLTELVSSPLTYIVIAPAALTVFAIFINEAVNRIRRDIVSIDKELAEIVADLSGLQIQSRSMETTAFELIRRVGGLSDVDDGK